MANLLHRNDKLVTFHNKWLKIPLSTSVHLAVVCKDHVLFVWVDLHISLCGQQCPKCEQAIHLLYLPFFYKLGVLSNPTNKNVMELGLECMPDLNSSVAVTIRNQTCLYELFFLYSDQYSHLIKYWPFFLNHPVFSATLKCDSSTPAIQVVHILLGRRTCLLLSLWSYQCSGFKVMRR
jgi:hypothetical protein